MAGCDIWHDVVTWHYCMTWWDVTLVHDMTWHYVTWHHVTWWRCYIMWCYVMMWCHDMLLWRHTPTTHIVVIWNGPILSQYDNCNIMSLWCHRMAMLWYYDVTTLWWIYGFRKAWINGFFIYGFSMKLDNPPPIQIWPGQRVLSK